MSKPYLWKESKTRKELEESKLFWKVFGIGFLFIIAILLIMSVSITIQRDKLKTQLSECQEQVKVWTLKIGCFQGEIFNTPFYSQYHINFTSYEAYNNFLENTLPNINCEVLE